MGAGINIEKLLDVCVCVCVCVCARERARVCLLGIWGRRVCVGAIAALNHFFEEHRA